MGDTKSTNTLIKFLRDFGFYAFAEVVPAALGLIGLIVFTHLFSPQAYGHYALALVAVTIGSTALFGWLEQAVLRYESGTDATVPNTISVSLALVVLVVGIGVPGYFVLGPFLNGLRPFYLAGVAAIATEGLFKVFRAVFQSRFQSKVVTVFQSIRSIIKLGLGVILSVFVFDSIVGWLWGMVLGGIVAILVMSFQQRLWSWRFDRDVVTRLARYGLPMVGWLFGFTLLTFLDRFLIEFLRNASAVGIYASNYTLVQVGLPLVLSPIIQAAHPAIMDTWGGDNHDEVADLIRKYSRYFLVLGVGATVFAAIISRPLSYLVLGSEYHSGYTIIPIIALALFIWNFAMLGHKGLELRDRTGMMTVGILITVLVNVLLNFALIPVYNYTGAAIATLVSTGVYALFAYTMSRQTIRWILPRRTIINVFVASSGMALVGFGAYLLGTSPVLAPIAGASIGSLIYFYLLLAANELTTDELAKAKSTVINKI